MGGNNRLVESSDLIVELKLIDGANYLTEAGAGREAKLDQVAAHEKWRGSGDGDSKVTNTLKEEVDGGAIPRRRGMLNQGEKARLNPQGKTTVFTVRHPGSGQLTRQMAMGNDGKDLVTNVVIVDGVDF